MSKEIREQTEGEKKLSQLLGEYMEEKKKNPEGFLEISNVLMCAGGNVLDTYMVTKQFGFIKRLVDNNKINKRKIDTRLVRYVENYYDEEGYWVESSYEDYSDTNTLLMLLSISDTPIEDLIDYLR